MNDDTKELFKFLDALPFAIETLADESVIKNQPLGDVSAVNDLLEFIHSGDLTDTAKEFLAEEQIELAKRRKVLNISKYDTTDELLDDKDMFQKAIDTGDKRRIAECLEMEVIPGYFIEANAKGIKPKSQGTPKGEWNVAKLVAMQTEYLEQLAHAIETGDFEKEKNMIEGKDLSAIDTARIRVGRKFNCSPSAVKSILNFSRRAT